MVHFGYGLGAIGANLIVRPFLKNKNSSINSNLSLEINSTLSKNISESLDADIRIPYLSAGGLCILVSVGHLLFILCKQNKDKKQKVNNI